MEEEKGRLYVFKFYLHLFLSDTFFDSETGV